MSLRNLPRSNRSGFTLIELLLAIAIFVLVIGTVYASLRGATQALVVGKETMQMYQTSRAGLNRMIVDLRRALAPAAFPFNEEEEDPMAAEDEYLEEEGPQMQVTFRGDSKKVEFVVRQEMETDDGPTMDIREVRYVLDKDNRLVKEIYRSLLEARLAEIQARRMEKKAPDQGAPERHRRFQPQVNDGYFDKPSVQVICENIQEVKFAYFDGEVWKDSWDSEEITINEFSREIDESELTEEDEEKVGLPKLVRCEVQVAKDIRLTTCTAIPSADLNIIGARHSESDFGSAYRSNSERLDRLRKGERHGKRLSDRDRGRRGRRGR